MLNKNGLLMILADAEFAENDYDIEKAADLYEVMALNLMNHAKQLRKDLENDVATVLGDSQER
jgi:2-phospho-L-lactate guanylyltransferase (CobY/MobA/RfbA family)